SRPTCSSSSSPRASIASRRTRARPRWSRWRSGRCGRPHNACPRWRRGSPPPRSPSRSGAPNGRARPAATETRARPHPPLAAAPFYRWGFVPARITLGSLVTHQFVHGGFLHLFFNMLFLWTVGGLLERTLGAARFLPVYLVGGVAAALAHAALNPASTQPAVGASGAVAAAMGAFAVLHARERMRLALVVAPVLAP